MDTNPSERSRAFNSSPHRRFWWHRLPGHDYVPPVYGYLSEGEWHVLADWYKDTEEKELVGEMAVPMISVLQGFIMGSGIRRVVQCGHYSGYSTLLLGFMLRRMGATRALLSLDIDPKVTEYTQGWVDRAGLADQVRLAVADSSRPDLPNIAREYLGDDPELVVIDSSHQYRHTLAELDLWYEAVKEQGLIFLHDTSAFATQYDRTSLGGVRRALTEWVARRQARCINLNGEVQGGESTVYGDGCGLGIIQRTRQDGNGPPLIPARAPLWTRLLGRLARRPRGT
jgi:predicted O-methyltransferase YrrM